MCSRTRENNKNKVGPVIWDTRKTHLEVEVRGVVGVEVLDPQQDLLDEEAGLLLGQSLTLRDEVKQLAAPEPEQV